MRGAVFVEERSAKVLVEALTSNLGLSDELVVVAHEGKNDLEKSFARKALAWRHPEDIRFVVSRDNDGADCAALKSRLRDLVPAECRSRVKVRLVMQELEGWYLGDFQAVAAGGLIEPGRAEGLDRQGRYAQPDRLTNAAQIFGQLSQTKGKIGWARAIGPHLDPERNRSTSLRHFVSALRWAAEPPAAA